MIGRRLVTLVAGAALLAAVLPGAVSAAQPDWEGGAQRVTPSPSGLYVVEMADPPVVAYKGGVPGLKATAPKKGQKIDPNSPEVVAYAGYLSAKHGKALGQVGGRKVYDYVYSYNGFAAALSVDQANKLVGTEGVVSVSPDAVQTLDTSSTPAFLGLNSGGLWDQLGGIGKAGDGIIIGIIDTGIWPESLSFTDRTGVNGNASKDGKLAYRQIPGWHGKCTPGEEFNASMCNQKLIGAQWFNQGYGGDAGIDANYPWEFNSPRDFGGHGSHTASTAGGNNGVPATGDASVFGTISGMAPHARIAAYKALWEVAPGQGSGYNTDLVAAIDQAVADGVDVINYSISGTQTNFRDPVEISFLYAAAAGIFVAQSAGNSGPTSSTVAHPGPWTTTVAAGTHNRDGQGSVTLGDGATYYGASAATPVAAPLIDAQTAGLPGADPTALRLCFTAEDNGGSPVLDPALVAGKIVVCDRGVNARINKSLAVMDAGGVGMILVNTSANSINADLHFVPTVHLQNTDRAAVKAYAATPGATASIAQSVLIYNAPAPYTAAFSSRGPLRASADLLKPDLMAPGQDILAAVAPPGNHGREFDLYSGTSMSSPHVAGLAALLKQAHPDWSPMAIKSALMTTGYDVLDGPNTNPLVIFRQGAGHVRPNLATDPGLVFDSSFNDWIGFLCGTQLPRAYCDANGIPVIAPSDFNGASIAIGGLPGQRTVTRTVKNVGKTQSTYGYSFSGQAGLDVSVSPAMFTLSPGESQSLQITVVNTGAALNAYVGGQLTWSDGVHSVRVPVVARPVALAAPVQVSSGGEPVSYDVSFGYTGPFTATARGLVPAQADTATISTGQVLDFPVVVPAGTSYARFSLFDANVAPAADLDLEVYLNGSLVGSSGSGTSAEEVNVTNPAAGTYTARVVGYATPNGPSTFTLYSWALGTADAGNMTVSAPASATLGTTGTISLSFSGLSAGMKYLGSIVYGGASGMPAPTLVRVDP